MKKSLDLGKEEKEEREEIQGLYDDWFTKKKHFVPQKFFCEKYILRENELGISILHLAAQSGQLDQVPKEFLTQEYLTRVNNRGRSVMAMSADCGHFIQIPKELWTRENLTKFSNPPVIVELAGSGSLDLLKLLPKEMLDKELLMTKDSFANTAYMIAARVGKFEQIPKNLIDKEVLLHEDAHNMTLMDHIATRGQLDLLDPKWINGNIILNKKESPILDSIVIYSQDHKCTKQLKRVLKALSVSELEKILESKRYPEQTDILIEKELRRQKAIESLSKNLGKKTKEISIY